MIADPHAVQISIDGSCYPNQGYRSGYAGIVVYPDDPKEYPIVFQGFVQSTIQRMELGACVAALEWVREQRIGSRYSRVQIFSDSQYVVEWQHSAPYWQSDGWRNAKGRPIDNWKLWKAFLAARTKAGVRVDILKVKNKSTARLQRVDQLAKAAANSHPKPDRELVIGKIGRTKIKGRATMFPAANEVLVIRIVGSKVVGPTRENRFVFETYDEASGQYVSKYFAYCNPQVGVQLHRQRGFRVRMNANPKYPQILDVVEEVPLPKVIAKRSSGDTALSNS